MTTYAFPSPVCAGQTNKCMYNHTILSLSNATGDKNKKYVHAQSGKLGLHVYVSTITIKLKNSAFFC